VTGGARPLGTLLGPEGVAVATISGDLTVDEPPALSCLWWELAGIAGGWCGEASVNRGGPPVS
jgi:hypothetical protein